MESKEEVPECNQIPFDKIRNSLLNAKADIPKIVLLSTGSLNPVHKMHVAIFDIAKKYLEENKIFQVVGGFLSPSHDMYVGAKLRSKAIPSSHRAHMCKLALEEHPWVSLSTWEINQDSFVDFPYVAIQHRASIQKEFPKEKIQLGYLCGADHALKCGLEQGLRSGPVICIGRKGSIEELKSIPQKKGMFYLIESHDFVNIEVSSTLIRERVQRKENIDDLTFPKVAEYLKNYYS